MAADPDDLLAIGMGARHQDGVGSHIAPVLAKKGPVGGGDELHQAPGQLHHDLAGVIGAVGQGQLVHGGLVDNGVPVAEDHGAVAAHVVNILVSVYVRVAAAFGFCRVVWKGPGDGEGR